jgi:hypothetical protein
MNPGNWIAQYSLGWTTEGSDFDQQTRLFPSACCPTLWPTQPPIKLYRDSFPRGQSDRSLNLITHTPSIADVKTPWSGTSTSDTSFKRGA